MKKEVWRNKKFWVFLFTITYLVIFGFVYIKKRNYEFMGYVLVMLVLILIVYPLNKRYNFSPGVLFGFSMWGILHMLGGTLKVGEGVLYKLILVPIYQNPEISEFVIFKFDQFAHFYFYLFAVIFSLYLIKPYLNKKYSKTMISVLLVFIAIGIGAVNEIIEFILVLFFTTGVGGYYNTMLDIIFNTFGAIVGVLYLNLNNKI